MKLREYRLRRKIPAETLAKAIKKSVKTYYKKETAEVGITLKQMEILAKILEGSVQEIFFSSNSQ